nr:MAG TPA: hypothetical protein [Caudoviricetes sp.]DAY72330.1 MAG TPA: hypothetical protein [Caudoviricetes sp.]
MTLRSIRHYPLLTQWFEFLFTANRNTLTYQPIYKSFTLASLVVPPYHHFRPPHLHRPDRQVNKVILR